MANPFYEAGNKHRKGIKEKHFPGMRGEQGDGGHGYTRTGVERGQQHPGSTRGEHKITGIIGDPVPQHTHSKPVPHRGAPKKPPARGRKVGEKQMHGPTSSNRMERTAQPRKVIGGSYA